MARETFLPTLILLLVSATAGAVGVTGHLDGLASDMADRRDELAADPGDRTASKAVKSLEKGLKVMEKPATSRDYSREVKAASKVAKILEKKLAAETALLASLDEVVAAYRADLEAARDVLAEVAASPSLGMRESRKFEKALAKADRFLDLAKLATTRAKRLKKLSAAAKILQDYVEDDGEEPLPGETATWVLSEIALAPAEEGLDLDGDGSPDNVLGSLSDLTSQIDPELDLNAMIADWLATSDSVLLFEMWGIEDWDTDPDVRAGLMNGLDTDGDPSDNFSGSEAFDVTGSVAADGHPVARTDTGFEGGGSYGFAFESEAVEIGGIVLPEGTPVAVSGTATPSANGGLIGFAVPVTVLIDLIEELGYEVTFLVRIALNAAADQDVDGDGTNDSISGALSFDSVPASTAP